MPALRKPFWGSYSGRSGLGCPIPLPLPCGGLWRGSYGRWQAFERTGGSAGWEWTATDLIRRNEQRLEELLLEGLATPAEELSAESLEQLRRDVRELIAQKRTRSNVGNLTNSVG